MASPIEEIKRISTEMVQHANKGEVSKVLLHHGLLVKQLDILEWELKALECQEKPTPGLIPPKARTVKGSYDPEKDKDLV